MANYSAASQLDAVLGALADPVRRAVVEKLAQGGLSAGALAAPHPISLPAFLKHLAVLERAGLVRTVKRGRVRHCRLDPGALKAIDGWLEPHRRLWEGRLGRLEETLRDMQADNKENP